MKINNITTKIQSTKINTTIAYKSLASKPQIYPVPDSFIKSNNTFIFDKQIEKFSNNLKKQTNTLTPKDIFIKAKNISYECNISPIEVLKVLNTITQFSSYKCFPDLEKEFNKKNIKKLNTLNIISKEGLSNFQPNLHLILKYVLNKNSNINFQEKEASSAIILDTELLKYLKELSNKNKEEFNKIKNNSKNKFFYIPNFENSYNVFNQNEPIETFTIKLLKNIKKNNITPSNIQQKLYQYLNKENLELIKDLDLNVEMIEPTINQDFSTTTIANQLNPILPEEYEIKDLINSCIIATSNNEKYQNNISNFLNKMTVVISPQEYANQMKQIHKKILNFVKQQGRNIDSIYYAVPNTNKSFILALYEYKKANKIQNLKTFYPDESCWSSNSNYFNYDKLPNNSTLVLIDDCAITGASLMYEQFNYSFFNNRKNSNNVAMIIAPLTITKKGKENIINFISEKDKIITVKTLPDWSFTEAQRDFMFDFPLQQYLTSLILPYMGPDTNREDLIPLYNKFFINNKAQKSPIINLEFEPPAF